MMERDKAKTRDGTGDLPRVGRMGKRLRGGKGFRQTNPICGVFGLKMRVGGETKPIGRGFQAAGVGSRETRNPKRERRKTAGGWEVSVEMTNKPNVQGAIFCRLKRGFAER